MNNEDCIFCGIIDKKVPGDIVYEDEYVIAFKDIHPVAPVHILVIPKKHILSINEINESNEMYIAKIYTAIAKIAKDMNISEKGYRVICNTGNDGGQVVSHIHFHILGGRHLGPKLVRDDNV